MSRRRGRQLATWLELAGVSGLISGHGAYGLRLSGLDGAERVLQAAPPSWPELAIERRPGRATQELDTVSDDEALFVLRNGGEVAVERSPLRATFTMPVEVSDVELVHPYLAPVAAVAGRWRGRESLHAGSYATAAGAWGLLGGRESGKSSTLAALALAGNAVVCDDLIVLDGPRVLAGPRSVDLRADAARRLGVGEELGLVGARERWRLALDPVEPASRLLGWIFLGWGERLELEPVPAGDRLRRIAAARSLRVPPRDPGELLRLAALPGWELRRPRGWEHVAPAIELLAALRP